jgi:molybdenum cofactor guanylyltransferase
MTSLATPTPLSRTSEAPPLRALGAILAGGASRRFGAVKGLAAVAGIPLVERVRSAVAAAVTDPVIITQLPELAALPGLPSRADVTAGAGPLAGIEAALEWAAERGLPGALCVACDMPFLSAPLLREIAREGMERGAPALVPESASRAGFEPLCAWYALAALPLVRAALEAGERKLSRAVEGLNAARLPLARVAAHGDPAVLFLNVNTPAGWREAEEIAMRGGWTD